MSTLELLDTKEAMQAAEQGWALQHVFDGVRWIVQALPLRFGAVFPHAEAAGAYVVRMARLGNPLAIKALRIIMQGAKS
jgi:hypothetical protein